MLPRLAPADLARLLDPATDAPAPVVIDARLKYPFEHSAVMLPDALRIGPGDAIPALPSGRPVVVYDSDPEEMTAERVGRLLARRGYDVTVLAGGIAAWMTAKLPVRTKPAPRPAAPMGGR